MEHSDWTVRPARLEDLPALGPIEAIGDAQFPAGRFPCDPGADNVPLSELEQGLEQGLLWVAAETGGSRKVFAFLFARVEGTHMHLRQIVVLPEWQRRGVGREMIARLEAETRCRGLRTITLTTFADIPWNAPVYRKMGFREAGDGLEADPDFAYLADELAAEIAAGMVHRTGMAKNL